MLEQVALSAGGAFLLARVDSDSCRALAGALSVKALPAVFLVRRGQLVDSFVGVPAREELQAFFMRTVHLLRHLFFLFYQNYYLTRFKKKI